MNKHIFFGMVVIIVHNSTCTMTDSKLDHESFFLLLFRCYRFFTTHTHSPLLGVGNKFSNKQFVISLVLV